MLAIDKHRAKEAQARNSWRRWLSRQIDGQAVLIRSKTLGWSCFRVVRLNSRRPGHVMVQRWKPSVKEWNKTASSVAVERCVLVNSTAGNEVSDWSDVAGPLFDLIHEACLSKARRGDRVMSLLHIHKGESQAYFEATTKWLDLNARPRYKQK